MGGKLFGDKNPAWKGDKAGFASVHEWINRNFAKMPSCEICGKPNDGTKWFEWSNKDHKYSRKREDWQHVCRSCHNEYDQKHNQRPLVCVKKTTQWGRGHDSCKMCGTTDREHVALGTCKRCYPKIAKMSAEERRDRGLLITRNETV